MLKKNSCDEESLDTLLSDIASSTYGPLERNILVTITLGNIVNPTGLTKYLLEKYPPPKETIDCKLKVAAESAVRVEKIDGSTLIIPRPFIVKIVDMDPGMKMLWKLQEEIDEESQIKHE